MTLSEMTSAQFDYWLTEFIEKTLGRSVAATMNAAASIAFQSLNSLENALALGNPQPVLVLSQCLRFADIAFELSTKVQSW